MRVMSLNTFGDSATGGAAQVMETLMLAFLARGHEVSIAATRAEPGISSFVKNGVKHWRAGIRNIYWPRLDRRQPFWLRRSWHLLDIYNPFMEAPLAAILEAERPDVVLVHNLTGWSVAVLRVIKARSIPIIQILHDHYYICSNSAMFKNGKACLKPCVTCQLMRAPHRRISRRVDAVVGVSRYILERHLACGAFEDVATRAVIPNSISTAALGLAEAPSMRAAALAARKPGVLRLGFIGALVPPKGIEFLLNVFSNWNCAQAELWVAGSGDLEYEAELKRKFAGPRVTFLGRVAPKNFFTAIDATVVPSLWEENLPGVIFESLAFGVPVIASKRGGIPEMISNGENGILFDPEESGALMNALQSFWRQKEAGLSFNWKLAPPPSDQSAWVDSYLSLFSPGRQ